MKENKLDNSFWNLRYQNNETGWDLGKISEPIKAWFDNQENKMNVCERHFWYLYDPDSGDEYCRLSNP